MNQVESLREVLVLVVDDEMQLRCWLIEQLQSWGLKAEGIGSTEELPNAIRHLRPDVLFLDLALGENDGIEAMAILKAEGYSGTISLMSGHHRDLLHHAATVGRHMGLRMNATLPKPIRINELRAAVNIVRPAIQNHGRPKSEPGLLGKALSRDWVRFFFQPKIDLKHARVVGAECLVRIEHPVRGILAPSYFIDAASKEDHQHLLLSGLSDATSCHRAMSEAGIEFSVSVNVAGRLLDDPMLLDRLRYSIRGLHKPRAITLELTETDVLQDIVVAQAFAARAKIAGFSVSIDDFGSGYATFERLTRIPFTELKLDRSIIHGCADRPSQMSICRAAVNLAHDFGAKLVAEGVERPADLRALRDLGVDEAQGFIFSPALPIDELITYCISANGIEGNDVTERCGVFGYGHPRN